MTTETSDLSDYQTKITVSYSDITLANETFTMYFNETIIQDDDWDDDDEQEEESRIEGIVLVGDATYPIWGEKEIEGNESEVKFVYQLSDTTFVQVEQEKEANEQEFTYTVKEAGVTTYSYSLEVEDDEVELKVKDKAALSSLTMKFDLHKENVDTYIRAKVNNSGTTSTVLFKKVVDATTGEVSYEVISNQ